MDSSNNNDYSSNCIKTRCDLKRDYGRDRRHNDLFGEDNQMDRVFGQTRRQGPCRYLYYHVKQCEDEQFMKYHRDKRKKREQEEKKKKKMMKKKDNNNNNDNDEDGNNDNNKKAKKKRMSEEEYEKVVFERNLPCVPYMLPFALCVRKYRDLYTKMGEIMKPIDVHYKNVQQTSLYNTYRRMEKNVKPLSRQPILDWSGLMVYYTDTKSRPIPIVNTTDDAHAHAHAHAVQAQAHEQARSNKTHDDTREPKLIDVLVDMTDIANEAQEKEAGGELHHVYVRDEAGTPLLPSYEFTMGGNKKGGNDDDNKRKYLWFMVKPLLTQEITVYAVFKQRNGLLKFYKSEPVALADIAETAHKRKFKWGYSTVSSWFEGGKK